MNKNEIVLIPLIDKMPDGWRSEIVSEDDPAIHPKAWKQGQMGMVGNVIKPADQRGAREGQIRVIFIEEPRPALSTFSDDILG